jgi:hypothetical protein
MPKTNQLRKNIRMAAVFPLIAVALGAISACSSVGSESWCENLKEKPKGDWSANEAKDYTKHCLFK